MGNTIRRKWDWEFAETYESGITYRLTMLQITTGNIKVVSHIESEVAFRSGNHKTELRCMLSHTVLEFGFYF